jgi:hypothetical protein
MGFIGPQCEQPRQRGSGTLAGLGLVDMRIGLVNADTIGRTDKAGAEIGMHVQRYQQRHIGTNDGAQFRCDIALGIRAGFGRHGAVQRQQYTVRPLAGGVEQPRLQILEHGFDHRARGARRGGNGNFAVPVPDPGRFQESADFRARTGQSRSRGAIIEQQVTSLETIDRGQDLVETIGLVQQRREKDARRRHRHSPRSSQTDFIAVTSSKQWMDLSRPRPDCFMPPKGRVMSPVRSALIHTTPV